MRPKNYRHMIWGHSCWLAFVLALIHGEWWHQHLQVLHTQSYWDFWQQIVCGCSSLADRRWHVAGLHQSREQSMTLTLPPCSIHAEQRGTVSSPHSWNIFILLVCLARKEPQLPMTPFAPTCSYWVSSLCSPFCKWCPNRNRAKKWDNRIGA